MKTFRTFLGVTLLFCPMLGFTFDTETHAAITRAAWEGSLLNAFDSNSLSARLGIDRLGSTLPFQAYWTSAPAAYYYMDGGVGGINGNMVAFAEPFERCQMQRFLNSTVPGDYQIFGNTVDKYSPWSQDTLLPVQNWLVRGAIREDDIGEGIIGFVLGWTIDCSLEFETSDQGTVKRSLNHFYDPWSGIGLTTSLANGKKSVDWALGYLDSFANPPQIDGNRGNHYSYADARNTFWWALTRQESKALGIPYGDARTDAQDRLYLWATTFRALGDVVHLLEDTAQPQHTRNDPHSIIDSGEQQAFEGYTNARVVGTGGVNSYVRGFFGDAVSLTAPPLGKYDAPMFSTPARFFSTPDETVQEKRTGLADYTNRGFFTGGTLPETTTEPSPPHPLDTSYGMVVVNCPELADNPQLNTVTCTHYTHVVPDTVAPGYVDQLPCYQKSDGTQYCYSQPPLVSESVFRQILPPVSTGTTQQFIPETALGIAELDTIGNMTIPRAVAYATGMLNYFFRGTLQVSAPASGIYAIVNHGTPHVVNDGVPYLVSNPNQVFGFTQIRLQVQNVTQPIKDPGKDTAVQQTAGGTGAKMVAIAHYHRNECYKPDLSGDASMDVAGKTYPPACTGSQLVRTTYPEISVSAPVSVFLGMLDGQQPIEQQFDFSNDPIPINATDVFIQVAYRGQLGDEPDGIAVGMIDVSEPTYEGDLAMTDVALQYQEDGSTWKWENWTDSPWKTWTSPDTGQTFTHAPPDPVADLAVTKIEICSGDSEIYYSGTAQLPSGHIVRIATLRDFVPHPSQMQVTYQGQFAQFSSIGTGSLQGAIRQAPMEMQGYSNDSSTDVFHVDALFWGRGVVGAGSFSYISPCAAPYPNNTCPIAPQDPPSPWTAGLPNITPPQAGFISENIGEVYLPASGQTPACTITGGGQPYSRIAVWSMPTATGQTITLGSELR